jgi:PIN domain nuclease of toxin-antitoxin system
MRLLVDAHTLVWAVDDPSKLSVDAIFDHYGVNRVW